MLWRHGRLSAREVHERLGDPVDWAYSTTRTNIDRMAAKGLIGKRRFHGIYLFEPRISRPAGLAGVVRELAERVLEVDYAPIVSLIAEGTDLTDDEIAELERLLEEAQ